MSVTQKAPRRPQTLIHCFGILGLATLLVLVGCDDLSGPSLGDDEQVQNASPEMLSIDAATHANASRLRKGLATFRCATAPYHRIEAAVEDGFEQILPCLSNPNREGAIGLPYAKLDRIDASINLAQPEILFYEPKKDGTLRLVGGEPVIPVNLRTENAPLPLRRGLSQKRGTRAFRATHVGLAE